MNHHLLLLRLVLAAVLMMNLPAAGGVDLLARPLETSWKPFSADPATKLADVWQVKDGVLVCKGHPLGGIYLDRDLADFTLRLEWRWPAESETGKGGVLLRAAAPWKIWPRSLEAQLNVGQAGDFWGLGGFSLAGPEDRLKRLDHPEFGKLTNLERTATAEKPPGEWNQYEIVAAGPVVTLKVNGKLVNRTSNCDRHPGKICLTSEGNEIQFRNIRLFTTAADATRAEPAPAAPGGTLETGFLAACLSSGGFAEPAIIPRPVEMRMAEGQFIFSSRTQVIAEGEAAAEARKLIDALEPPMGHRLALAASHAPNSVRLRLDREAEPELGAEGYRLRVTPEGVDLSAAQPTGLFYAVQTLRQLLPPAVYSLQPVTGVDWTVPCVEITDYPRFSWRGLLIDPARHFIPVDDVKRFIDLMALHKFNRLQIHLNDDQGWRIEIKKYPRLTEVGAWRHETLIGHASQQPARFDGIPHGGFYSQDDIRHLVRYAAERHVTLVPEISMPGHCQAAIAAYPELGVFPQQQRDLRLWTQWGISEHILAPRPQTVEFCQDVLTEVMGLFPSRYLHIGGDEAIKNQWRASAEMQELIRQHGLQNEEQLQAWFTQQLDTFLTRHGRRLVGWDEILEGGLAPGAVVMSWRGKQGGITAAQAGHDVIMAPTSHTYFDNYQGPPESEPLAIGGFLPLERVYQYEPVPAILTPEQAPRVLGAQAQLWGEYIKDAHHREYMAYPRASAMAEVVWSAEKDSYVAFVRRLGTHLERLRAAAVNLRPL